MGWTYVKRRSISWPDSGHFELFISGMYPAASLEEGGRSSNTERKVHPGYQSSVTPYFTYTYSIETRRRICCNDLCEASSDGIDR
jgi:hypothetical protein